MAIHGPGRPVDWVGSSLEDLKAAIYVLHCFQKKANRGIATPSREMELIAKRLKLAIADSKGANL